MDSCNVHEFPFSSLSDSELLYLTLKYDIDDTKYDMNSVLEHRTVISDGANEINDEQLQNNLQQINKTVYVTLEEINKTQTSSDSLSVLQINSRSLKKILNR